jgi:hypothetical protein
MFSMSVKSVPGCLVLIAPSVIGVPVAAVPGLGPHDDVPEDVLAAAVVELDDAAAAVVELALLLLLLLLLPQPTTKNIPRTAAVDSPSRTRGT